MTPEKVKLCVLLLEDNPADQKLIKQFFKHALVADFTLKMASDLAEAEAVLAKNSIHVMLVDLELPDSRGLHAVENLVEHWPAIPIVVLTGHDDELLGINAVKIGAQDYLIKGQVTREIMVRAVRYAVERKRSQVLLEQQTTRQAAIVELGHQALREKPIDDLLRHAAGLVHETLDIAGCCIIRYSVKSDEVEMVAAEGLSNPDYDPRETAFIRSVLNQAKPVTIENVKRMKTADSMPGWVKANKISALHCVTIPQDQTPYGVLFAFHTAPRPFTRDEQVFLAVVVNLLAEALQRFRARQGLERALEKAKKSEQVKNLFLANMSHEIRTPLNSILGFISLIEKAVAEKINKEERSFFGLVRESSERLMRTVHEVLDIAQIEADSLDLDPVEIDLGDLLEAQSGEWQERASAKNLSFTIQCEPSKLLVKADRYCIEEALGHLVDNAIKFTDAGGITIRAEGAQKHIILSIEDTGIGMSPRFLENVFQAFTQESSGYSKKFQGVGLGLALTKRYLELNGVAIDVSSTVEAGSTVTLTFAQNLQS
ncbi:MAG: response regulator [Candidatus Marinimicrobia bacterium]|nr:response regulator [Candidatus Neomarinimicrobiota bacterium]MCF7840107.1 response regulator [Candidatus Neomarinimicrobiota bacterium]MCF7902891.1 response regulator [Candidatus Neomarinimicrobiota bacterium]